jgi:adenosylcobyric acid synthase
MLTDFSHNLNFLGPPPWFSMLMLRVQDEHYENPQPYSTDLCHALAHQLSCSAEQLVVGPGARDLMPRLPRALDADRMIFLEPHPLAYQQISEAVHLPCCHIPPMKNMHHDFAAVDTMLKAGDMVFISNPALPTGLAQDLDSLKALIVKHARSIFVLDEAFIDFAPQLSAWPSLLTSNVVILRSFSHFYGLAGVRLGYAIASPTVAEKIQNQCSPWSVSTLAQKAGIEALRHPDFVEQTQRETKRLREIFVAQLQKFPQLEILNSVANFICCRSLVPQHQLGFIEDLQTKYHLKVKSLANYAGCEASYFSLTVRSADDNTRVIDALQNLWTPAKHQRKAPRPIRASLMIQGTSSNAGKSFLCSALCRILHQDGWDVAPFKAQNMSLNSFVSERGEEMGRAQVLQAEACRRRPDARMNPILIKPNSHTHSQIIVMGKPVGHMSIAEYNQYKPQAFKIACEAYDDLARESQCIIIEGAGSPGEINLKQHDIVNMRMAQYAHSPVLVVGDIDRGGVFASFAGTAQVLDAWERKLLRGFIVNRFRGDPTCLEPAFQEIETRTGKKVLGPIPYMERLQLPEEDSVGFRDNHKNATNGALRLVFIDTPQISNFSDLDALRIEDDLQCVMAKDTKDCEGADVILLLGSKNTLADLHYLKQQGFVEAILKAANSGTEIVGICGGLQILGRTLHDPHAIESSRGSQNGLGLLAIDTTMQSDKILTQTSAIHLPTGLTVRGYQIHHGLSSYGDTPLFMDETQGLLGVQNPRGHVWGTYLHGIFDNDDFRHQWLNTLRSRKGIAPKGGRLYNVHAELDRCAAVVRESLDMDYIYSLIDKRHI